MKYSYILTATLILSACSSKDPKQEPVRYKKESPEISTIRPAGPSVTAEMIASELGTDLLTEISFKKGSSDIGPQDKQKLKNLFNQAEEAGEVTKVQAITWADQEYPSDDKVELSPEQQELVAKRNDAIKNLMAGLDSETDFSAIDMSQRTTFLGRLTASEKATVKKSLKAQPIATTSDQDQGPSKASKSIILLFTE